MRILVTGGAGFIGSHITKKLIENGHEVAITSTGSEKKIEGVAKVYYTGLTGIGSLQIAPEIVLHQMANNDTLCDDRHQMMNCNRYGPAKLFNMAYDLGCRNFVYASSTAVYGNSPAPYDEQETKINPLNAYGKSKYLFDKFAMNFAEERQVKVTGLRYCNVYGPGESHKGSRMSMIGQILRIMMKGESPKIFEWGIQRRDWVYIKDVLNANLLAMFRTKGRMGEIYNIGSGQSYSFNQIIQTINDVQGTEITPTYIKHPFPEKYQDHTECKIEKAHREMGLSINYDLRSGIQEYRRNLIDDADSSS